MSHNTLYKIWIYQLIYEIDLLGVMYTYVFICNADTHIFVTYESKTKVISRV